jgi:hypothetical protein
MLDLPTLRLALRKLALRVAFVYFALYLLPFPLDVIPVRLVSESAAAWLQGHVFAPYEQGMDAAVKWIGARYFGLTITILPAGSGDTTWNYVQLAGFGAVSLGAALLWTLVDLALRGARSDDTRIHDWLHSTLRLYLSITLLGYGMAKVIKAQMPTPGLDSLMQPFGEGSPMGLLWNFVGFSQAYCVFTGAAEMLGGLLLANRRTATLGSLVATTVLINVVMMNFCFDTPVKLFSSNLLLMSCWLALPDAKKLLDVLVFHRTPKVEPPRPLFRTPVLHWIALAARTLLIGWVVWSGLKNNWERRNGPYGDLGPKPPLYGTWDVEVFEVDGEIVPEEELGHPDAWKRLRIGRYRLGIERRDGSFLLAWAQATPKSDRLNVNPSPDPGRALDGGAMVSFKCELTTPDALTIDAPWNGRQLHVELARAESSGYLLVERGFHWINEYPFNR